MGVIIPRNMLRRLELLINRFVASSWCLYYLSVPEDGRDYRPKHVALIGIINKPLLLHLVGVYIT